jgi:hypothetical protein
MHVYFCTYGYEEYLNERGKGSERYFTWSILTLGDFSLELGF